MATEEMDDTTKRELARKEKLTKAMMSEIRAMLERYNLVYGLPFEDALSAQATMVLTTLSSIHPENQKVLLPQMLDILDQREKELFGGSAPAPGSDGEPAADAQHKKPTRPAAKIAKKVRGG